MSTDQYRPCWIELDEESEPDDLEEEEDQADGGAADDTEHTERFGKFYGRYDNEKTPKDEKAKLEKLYWEGKLSDE